MSVFVTDSQQELLVSGFFFFLFGMCGFVALLHLLHFLIMDADGCGNRKERAAASADSATVTDFPFNVNEPSKQLSQSL